MSSEREETSSSKPQTNNNNNNNSGGGGSSTPTKQTTTEPEQLPCPRCDSTNTKFCYYNNYNLSQPRHFCKACRRYWTRGGALRNVPIGGGTRRSSSSSSNKRPRTDPAPPHQEVLSSVPVSEMQNTFVGHCYDMNLNEALPETGSFSSLLNGESHHQGGVFMGVPSRYVGVGSGLYGMGFGLNMFDFPVEQMRDVGGPTEASGGGGGGNADTWQLEGGNINMNNMNNMNNDNFSWPDLAISTPGKSLK